MSGSKFISSKASPADIAKVDLFKTKPPWRGNVAGCSNNIRGIFGTGNSPAPGTVPNTIDYITIATLGDSVDFGDLYLATYSAGAMASQTRGMFVGGANHPAGVYQNILQDVNISTTGNAQDFGDMATLRGSYDGNTSDCHGGLGQWV